MIAKFASGNRCDRLDRVRHQEADADDEVVVLLGEAWRGSARSRRSSARRRRALDAELLLGMLEALVREEVEGAVVEAADVGDEPDPDPGATRPRSSSLGPGRRRRVLARLLAVAAAAAGERQREQQQEPVSPVASREE